MHRALLPILLAGVLGISGASVAADAAWPGFRGPNFDGTVHAARLFEGDAVGLTVGWSVALGPGYSALAIGDGRVAAMYGDGDGDYLAAYSVESGERLWRYRVSEPHKGHDGSHDGPISTPAMDGGRIFGLGAWGQLFAVDAATGRELWVTHLIDDLGAGKPWYGFASSPRIVDGVLVLELSRIPEEESGAEAQQDAKAEPAKPMAVAGIDPANGKPLWIAGDDHIEYHSPVVATLSGQRQVLAAGKNNLYGLEAKTGRVLWTHRHEGDERAMGGMKVVPVPAGEGRVFLMNKIDSSVMLRVERKQDAWEVSELWSGGTLARSYVPPVYHEGYLYGMNNRIFTCMDAATGEAVWRSREPGDGFPTLIGDHLVMITKPGSLHVIDASPTGYRELARLDLFQEHSWSEVAYADGHLFARSMGRLARVDLTAPGVAGGDRTWVADTLLGRFLAELDTAADKPAAIDAFLAAHPASPIVEDDGSVHFLYRGSANDVGIVGDVIGFRREDPMTRVPGTDLFHYSTRLEPTAAATYGLILDFGTPVADPRNPRAASGFFGDLSWFAMPAWSGPDYPTLTGSPGPGRLEVVEWTSAVLEGQPRKVEVYLPAGYDQGDRRYPVAYVHSGKLALEQGGMKRALDHLIGSRIAPVIAVFIHPPEENPERDQHEGKYREMVATELLPKIDGSYRTIADARSRASIGSGHIASAAVLLGFEHPELFRRVAGQSPLMGAEDIPELSERGADERPLVIYLDWGTYHMRSPHEAWSLVDSNRELWTALRDAGYRPAGGELPEGFGWPIWAGHTDELLVALFPLEP